MKNVFRIVTLIFLVTLGCTAYIFASEGVNPAQVSGSYAVGQQDYGMNQPGNGMNLDMDYAYNYLAPYGNWVNMAPYGYVWIPRNMGYRWRPYSDGHWVMTDYGWTWISDLEWGWIPFHYGRWGWDDGLGWYWVPGNTWGPAYVGWRSNDMNMGWAAMPPGMEFRAGMNFGSIAIGIPSRFWIFIDGSHFMDNDMYPYVLPYERNATLLNYTTPYNNYNFRGNSFVNEGIGIDTVRRFTGRDVPRYTIRDARQAGQAHITGNELQIYRPSFKSNSGAKPKTFLNKDQAQPVLAPAKIFEPRDQPPKITTAAAVFQRQNEERMLLEQSQAKEIKALDLRKSNELKRVQAAAEKVKIQNEYQAKISDLSKQHLAETLQLNERHKTDTVVVKQVTAAKTQAPPKKKKK